MARVTVVVPVYNLQDYVGRCIESIRRQTFADFELILVNDGSTDGSGAICDAHAAADPRISVFHTENRGVSSARNLGIHASTSEFVTFVDSDDTIAETYLERLLLLVVQSPSSDYFASGMTMVDASGNRRNFTMAKMQTSATRFLEGLNMDYQVISISGPTSKLFRTKLLREHSVAFPEGMSLGEDAIFNLRYLAVAGTVATSSDTLYYYHRDREDSLFSSVLVLYPASETVCDEIRSLMVTKSCSSAAMEQFEHFYFSQLLAALRATYRRRSSLPQGTARTYLESFMGNEHICQFLREKVPRHSIGKLTRPFVLNRQVALLDSLLRLESATASKAPSWIKQPVAEILRRGRSRSV